MGQKVNPIALRLGIVKTWKSEWYFSSKRYIKYFHEDFQIRNMLYSLHEIKQSDVSDIEIERYGQKIIISIYTPKPGIIIGSKGDSIDKITNFLQKQNTKKIQIKVKEIKKPDINSQIIAQNIARQIKQRMPFRRVMKTALANAKKSGVSGIKIRVSGRLSGADMARSEEMKDGQIPLQTLKANIDYGFAESLTTYGIIGIKVWVYIDETISDNIDLLKKNYSVRGAKNVKSKEN